MNNLKQIKQDLEYNLINCLLKNESSTQEVGFFMLY